MCFFFSLWPRTMDLRLDNGVRSQVRVAVPRQTPFLSPPLLWTKNPCLARAMQVLQLPLAWACGEVTTTTPCKGSLPEVLTLWWIRWVKQGAFLGQQACRTWVTLEQTWWDLAWWQPSLWDYSYSRDSRGNRWRTWYSLIWLHAKWHNMWCYMGYQYWNITE